MPSDEPSRARRWRKAIGLSRRELAQLTGYSERAIAAYEAGEWQAGKPVTPASWRTYRLACAALSLDLQFDWRSVSAAALHRRILP